MSTELILLFIFIVEFLAIIILAKFPIRFVCGSIAINLLLIAGFGSTLIDFFGFTTNLGNVFYVAITFTFYILFDKYGREVAKNAIWSSLFLTLLFIFVAKLSVLVQGAPALTIPVSSRLIVASLLAFAVAQNVNLKIYERLSLLGDKNKLLLKMNISNIGTQIVDSLIFFPLAFYGVASSSVLGITLVGLSMKVLIGFLATGLLYLDRAFINRANRVNRLSS